MFINYELILHVDQLVGGIPKHPNIVKRWQEAKWPTGSVSTELAESGITPETAAEQTIADLGANAQSDDDVAGVWTSFVTMANGSGEERIALETRQIKSMLKESANIIKGMPEVHIRGKAIPLRSKLAERVFPVPKMIPILSDVELFAEDTFGILVEDGAKGMSTGERPIHVMTAQGPRTALKRFDYVDNALLECTLRVLDDGLISEKILRAILDHASLNGIGTDRSQGAGTFTYELKKD